MVFNRVRVISTAGELFWPDNRPTVSYSVYAFKRAFRRAVRRETLVATPRLFQADLLTPHAWWSDLRDAAERRAVARARLTVRLLRVTLRDSFHRT